MKIAVLGSASSWYFRDLLRVAGSHQLVSIPFTALAAAPGWANSGCSGGVRVTSGEYVLTDFDATIVRSMPPGSLEQIVFRMDVLGQLAAAGHPVINPPRGLEGAIDKFLTTAQLARAGICVPPTFSCQRVDEAMVAFEQLGGDVVVKPIFGGEGRGIARIVDAAIAQRTFQLLVQLGGVIYLQPFLPHEGYDIRVLLIGPRAHVIRRRNALDWRTNLARGAIAEPMTLDQSLVSLAQRAADIVGVPLAGIDLLPAKDGQVYVLEVNGVPGWKGVAEAHQRDIAAEIIDYVVAQAKCKRP